MKKVILSIVLVIPLGLVNAQEMVNPVITPPGTTKTTTTEVLEGGAKVIQSNRPVTQLDIYLVGFHPMKEQPEQQMETHHYCHQMNEDFAQCVLFDGNTSNANMNGVEFIISEKLFISLPEKEKKYWHPHNGEILSGQLVAPGIPQIAEKMLLKSKMNSYGKTWHVWNTGHPGQPNDNLPLGEPMLAWSFNRDGEADPSLINQRDERLGLDTMEIRKERVDLQEFAKPQYGVDDLKGTFARPTKDIPGVSDVRSSTPPRK